MVNTAMCECRRDILWTQMLASPNTVEEGRRKRSDIDDKEAVSVCGESVVCGNSSEPFWSNNPLTSNSSYFFYF